METIRNQAFSLKHNQNIIELGNIYHPIVNFMEKDCLDKLYVDFCVIFWQHFGLDNNLLTLPSYNWHIAGIVLKLCTIAHIPFVIV